MERRRRRKMTLFFICVVVLEEGQHPSVMNAHTMVLGSQSSPDSLSCAACAPLVG